MVIVNKTNNILLTSLSEEELVEFLHKVNNTPFYFRRKLSLSTDASFGNEIEFNSIPLNKAVLLTEFFNDVCGLDNKYVVHQEETAGAEVVTPILMNSESNWRVFRDMYSMLYETGATIAGNTSSHIHVGTHKINTPAKLSLLLKTLVVFEPIIFKFGYGFNNRPRALLRYRDENHCIFSPMMSPKRIRVFIEKLDKYNYGSPSTMTGYFKDFLRQDLLFRPVFNFNNFDFYKLQYGIDLDTPCDDHIEIRCFNGTLNPVIAQNNINLCASIVEAVAKGKIDEDYVNFEYEKYKKKRYNFDYKFAKLESEKDGEQYNRLLDGFSKVKLEKAIKLADMIFDTELDKIYFLKQYLKLFSISEEEVIKLTK